MPSAASMGLAVTAVIAAAVARVELAVPGSTVGGAVLTAAVVVAYPLAAVLAGGPRLQRALFVSVGLAWALPSWAAMTELVHQGVLIVALLAFPDARLKGLLRWFLAASAVPVALLWIPQPGVACLFLAVSAVSSRRLHVARAAALLPTLAGAVVGAILGAAWLGSRLAPASYQPAEWLIGYELALICVAAGYAASSRAVEAARGRSIDELVGHDIAGGVDGLATVLAEVLDDPDLRIVVADAFARPRRDEAEPAAAFGPPVASAERQFEVVDGDHLVAVVLHTGTALEDQQTARAVSQAVRLVVQNVQLRRELAEKNAGLAAARDRVAAAIDTERAVRADRLTVEVLEPLRALGHTLAEEAAKAENHAISEPLVVAAEEVDRSVQEIESLVAGSPAWRLGERRMHDALADMGRRRSIPVELHLDPGARAAPEVEAAMLFVASEVLANIDKHAGASRAWLELRAEGGMLHLQVTDDGRGGADPAGSGLHGLADRLAPLGGRLRVQSRPGLGTVVRAEIPAG